MRSRRASARLALCVTLAMAGGCSLENPSGLGWRSDAGVAATDLGAPPDDRGPDDVTRDVGADDAPEVLVPADVQAPPDVPEPTDTPEPTDAPDAGPGCPPGETRCGGECVGLLDDSRHCGACDVPCAEGQVCAAGQCRCPPGRGDCDRDATNGCETDLTATAAHCGGCGMSCAAVPNGASACTGGVCRVSCSSGFADCDGDATNGCETALDATVAHCGRCDNVCPTRPNASARCAQRSCSLTCAAGFGDCDGDASNGCEASTATSGSHCGRCGNSCGSGQVCTDGSCSDGSCVAPRTSCAGDCVDPLTNNAHCGGCNRPCPAGQTCAAGRCACPPGQTLCAGACVNTQSSPAHCGACGNACAAGATCRDASCRCPLGQAACGGRCVDIFSNSSHCGRCDNACGSGASCVIGICCGGRNQFCCNFTSCAAGLRCSLGVCRGQ